MILTFAILCWLLRVKRTSGKVRHHIPSGNALGLMVRALSNICAQNMPFIVVASLQSHMGLHVHRPATERNYPAF